MFTLICFTYYSLSHWEIGEILGKNRATVHHSCRTANSLIEFDPEYKTSYNEVLNELKELLNPKQKCQSILY